MKPEDFQRQFFRKAGPNIEILRQMADSMPNVRFNIVDDKNRVVAFNKANCATCNFRDESEIVGRRIEDAFPAVLADAYIQLYTEVRESGIPATDRICTHRSDRSTDLALVNVFPLRDDEGRIIGTTAFYRTVSNSDITPEWYGALKKAIAHIDRHYKENITLADLAAAAGMSKSTFCRVFTSSLSISPGEYITTIRINHARKLLSETSATVEQIALECGFYDQSHFIKAFKRERGTTPGRYRRMFWKE